MPNRDLPINELNGWLRATGTHHACQAALASPDTPDPVRKLCRAVIDIYNETELPDSPSRLRVVYAEDVLRIAGGLVLTGLCDESEYAVLQSLVTVPDPAQAELARNVVMREQEVLQYQRNVTLFEGMLAGLAHLPTEWPAELAGLRGKPRDSVAISLDDEPFSLWMELTYRDELRARLRTEKGERDKVQRILDALLLQLPVEGRDALLDTARRAVGV